MKKFLFIVTLFLIGLSLKAENQDTLKYYESVFTYSTYYYRFELLPNGDIIQTKESDVKDCVKYGVNCNKTTRNLKIFSIDKNNFVWGYSDSIVIMLKVDKDFANKLKKQYKIKSLSPKEIHAVLESSLLKKIVELYAEGSQRINNHICLIHDSIEIYSQNNELKIKNNENEFFIKYNEKCYPNSVGGCSPNVSIINCSKKPIKYFYFTCKFYNRVNDLVVDKISGKTNIDYGIVGPIEYLKGTTAIFDENFYNSVTDHYIVYSMTLEYMDGTSKTFNKNQIDAHRLLSLDEAKYWTHGNEIKTLQNELHDIYKHHEKHLGNVINYPVTNSNYFNNHCCETVTCSINQQVKELL